MNKKALIFMIVFLMLASVFGSHFFYSIRNSGRYLLPVIKATNPSLFQNDPEVDSLGKFKSVFYIGLTQGFKFFKVRAENIESIMFWLYALFKILLIFLFLVLSRRFTNNIGLFFLIASWAVHTKYVPVGNIRIFKPMITHESIALLLGLAVLIYIFDKKYLIACLFLAVSIFVHSLMALHLFLIIAPPLLLKRKYWNKKFLAGGILLIICSLAYMVFMSPSFLSDKEATIFVTEKGECMHVSPLNQDMYGWIQIIGFGLLSWLAVRFYLKENSNSRLMGYFVLSGFFIGIFLSFAAILTRLPFLALLQPMRIFVWVYILANILIAWAAIQTIKTNLTLGMLMLAIFILNIMNSQWFFIFLVLAILYMLGERLRPFLNRISPFILENLTNLGVFLIVCVMFIAWLPFVKHSFDSFRSPFPLLAGVIFILTIYKIIKKPALMPMIYGLLIYSVIVSSYYHHNDDFFTSKIDTAWDNIRVWCQENTNELTLFITPPEGLNFRILSLRTTLSEDMPALVWVDPFEYQKNQERMAEIRRGYSEESWDLEYLFTLANKWQAAYVIVKGSYEPEPLAPVFKAGDYRIFKAN